MTRLPLLQLRLVVIGVVAWLAPLDAAADPALWAIPPGQEATLESALRPTKAWPKGWTLLGISIQGGHVDVRYQPKGRGAVGVRLVHGPGDAPQFVLSPISAELPQDMRVALEAQLGGLTSIRWTDLRPPPDKPVHLPGPATDTVWARGTAAIASGDLATLRRLASDREAADCAVRDAWAGQLYALGRAPDFAIAVELAQSPTPCAEALDIAGRWTATLGRPAEGQKLLEQALQARPGSPTLLFDLALLQRQQGDCAAALATLGPLELAKVPHVAKDLARLSRIWIDCPDSELLARTRAAADATPPDAIAAFMAGAVLHHEGAWRTSDAYLAKSQALMANEPRQYLYRAMNAFHDGRQADAESLVAQASALGSQDPDVLYCRASILGDKQPLTAIADLETYEKAMAHTADRTDGKQERVAGMLADLRACAKEADVHGCRQRGEWLREVRKWGLHAALPLLLILGILAAIWRRRKDLGLQG